MNTPHTTIIRLPLRGSFPIGLALVIILASVCSSLPSGKAYAVSAGSPGLAPDVPVVSVDDDYTSSTPGYNITHFITIQGGVNAVDAGGTVQVEPGIYIEQVLIEKSLTLLGEQAGIDPTQAGARTNPANEAILRPNEFTPLDGNLITVKANNVTVDGFLLDGNNPNLNPQGDQSNGVYLHIAGGISNGTYSDSFSTEISGLQVRNSIFKNMNQYGVSLSSDTVSVRSNNLIDRNLFDNIAGGDTPIGSRHGIWLLKNQYSSVTNNKMTRTRVGLEMSVFSVPPPGGPISITGNDISSIYRGIWINGQFFLNTPGFITVSSNTLRSDSGSTINHAVHVNQIQKNVTINLIDNTITSGAAYGIRVVSYDSLNDLNVSGGSIGAALTSGFSLENDKDQAAPIFNIHARVVLDGVEINGGVKGVSVIDEEENLSKLGTLTAILTNDTSISSAGTGIYVSGADASVELINSDANGVSNNTTGVQVTNQGSFIATNSKISANTTGIRVENGGDATSLTNNFITDSANFGIRVFGGTNPGTVGTVLNNNFNGSSNIAVQNETAAAIVAGGNWWGGNTPAAVELKVSSGVDYSPWLDLNTDTNSSSPGFQGDFSRLRVDDILAETSPSAIQEGADLAALGGYVWIYDGSYPGPTNLNRNVNLEFASNVHVEGDLAQSAGIIDAPAGNLYFEEDFLYNGGVFENNGGTVLMNGTALQHIGGIGALALNNLQVNNNGGVALTGDVRVNGNLAMFDTLLHPGAFRLLLSATTSVGGSGLNSANMIVADDTGSVCKDFTGIGNFNFPIGDVSNAAHYSPVRVNFTSGSFTNGQVCARVTRGRYPHNFAVNYLQRYWTFTTSGISSYSADLTFTYSSDAEDIVGTKSVMMVLEYQNVDLISVGQTLLPSPNQFQFTTTVLNGRSYTAGNTLPLVVLSPSVVRLNGGTALASWSVAAEADVLVYNLLRADTLDGIKVNVGSAVPTGPNSSYTITDATISATSSYYFWIQADGPAESDFLYGPYFLQSGFSIQLPLIFRRR